MRHMTLALKGARYGTLLLLIGLLLPSMALAATVNNVLLSVEPKIPSAKSRATVTATVLNSDPSDNVFTWLVNDEEAREGVGANILVVDTPAPGEMMTIRVLVNGEERGFPLIIKPGTLSIEWEGITTLPPFYGGRPLLGAQGEMRAVAIPMFIRPNGTRVESRDITFTWKVNGSALPKQSGRGVTSATAKPVFYDDPFTLSVTAESADGIRAEHVVTVQPVQPRVAVYERSALGGLHDARAVTTDFAFHEDEVTLIAYPMHVSRPESVVLEWSLNGSPVQTQAGDQRIIVFRKTGEGSGSYAVNITLANPAAFLDTLERTFLLHF